MAWVKNAENFFDYFTIVEVHLYKGMVLRNMFDSGIEPEKCLLNRKLFQYRLGSYFHSLEFEKDTQNIRVDALILIL